MKRKHQTVSPQQTVSQLPPLRYCPVLITFILLLPQITTQTDTLQRQITYIDYTRQITYIDYIDRLHRQITLDILHRQITLDRLHTRLYQIDYFRLQLPSLPPLRYWPVLITFRLLLPQIDYIYRSHYIDYIDRQITHSMDYIDYFILLLPQLPPLLYWPVLITINRQVPITTSSDNYLEPIEANFRTSVTQPKFGQIKLLDPD